jgi:hypothetical protein
LIQFLSKKRKKQTMKSYSSKEKPTSEEANKSYADQLYDVLIEIPAIAVLGVLLVFLVLGIGYRMRQRALQRIQYDDLEAQYVPVPVPWYIDLPFLVFCTLVTLVALVMTVYPDLAESLAVNYYSQETNGSPKWWPLWVDYADNLITKQKAEFAEAGSSGEELDKKYAEEANEFLTGLRAFLIDFNNFYYPKDYGEFEMPKISQNQWTNIVSPTMVRTFGRCDMSHPYITNLFKTAYENYCQENQSKNLCGKTTGYNSSIGNSDVVFRSNNVGRNGVDPHVDYRPTTTGIPSPYFILGSPFPDNRLPLPYTRWTYNGDIIEIDENSEWDTLTYHKIFNPTQSFQVSIQDAANDFLFPQFTDIDESVIFEVPGMKPPTTIEAAEKEAKDPYQYGPHYYGLMSQFVQSDSNKVRRFIGETGKMSDIQMNFLHRGQSTKGTGYFSRQLVLLGRTIETTIT